MDLTKLLIHVLLKRHHRCRVTHFGGDLLGLGLDVAQDRVDLVSGLLIGLENLLEQRGQLVIGQGSAVDVLVVLVTGVGRTVVQSAGLACRRGRSRRGCSGRPAGPVERSVGALHWSLRRRVIVIAEHATHRGHYLHGGFPPQARSRPPQCWEGSEDQKSRADVLSVHHVAADYDAKLG